MTSQMKTLIHAENGATALEYGLLAALIATTIATAVVSLGNQVTAIFNDIASTISTAIAS